jgi:hypothetical protein
MAVHLATLGIPTRNRTSSLEACLNSHLDAARRQGRACAVVVIDDSDAPQTREANRGVLRATGAHYGAEVGYAGPQEKARFAAALAAEAGTPEEVVRFALLDSDGFPVATGGSRNGLLLHAAGEAFVQVDDDTIGRLALPPGAGGGLAFTSRSDPTEFWFLPESDPDYSTGPFIDEDFLGLHEQLLGNSPGDCLAAAGGVADLGHAGAGFFRWLEDGGGRVLVTAAGVAGDAGMGSSLHLLTLDGASRCRLLATEQAYRQAVGHRRVLRAVLRPTVGDAAFCQALNLGLDNRDLLPPFLPVQRNQEGVFAAVLRVCFSGAFFGYLPRALLHRPPVWRGAPTDDPWGDAGRLLTGHLFQVLIGALAVRPAPADPRAALVALGRSLTDFAASEPIDFEAACRVYLGQALTGWGTRLEAQLRAFGGLPGFWADDVGRVLVRLRGNLADPGFAVPWDLRSAFGAERAGSLTRRLVGRFGRLLQAWPALVEAAKALRGRGMRLAQPV